MATLVMGLDGCTSKDGSSAGVSTNSDRERFLKRRREFDCIIIGGNTARSERYAITPCPLVVISRHKSNVLITNPNAYWWNMEPVQALEKAKREFGPDILIETVSHDIALEVDFDAPLVDAMKAAILAHDPEGIPVPYLMSGGTDNKALSEIGIVGYGFSPLRLPADLDFMSLFHGVDERVPIDGLRFGVRVLNDFLKSC